MTTELQLVHALHNVPGFWGCFASDELPTNVGNNCRFIVNTSPRNSGGTHWVAIDTGDAQNPPYFFDSFGQDLSQIQALMGLRYNKQWITYMQSLARRNGHKSYEYNHYDLQCLVQRGFPHRASDLCGEYCALFVKWGPVQDAQGRIRKQWQEVTSIQSLCDAHENTVKRLSGVKRN